jgi:3-dehydro-L-gulonate 2-dehydrogenase
VAAAAGRLLEGLRVVVVLDMIAAMMSLGHATHQLAADPLLETGVSQMFLTMNPAALGSAKVVDKIADEIVASVQNSKPATAGKPVRYPGEQTLKVRAENTELGLPVEPEVWAEILAM